MGLSTHWEWRGFGQVSTRFRQLFMRMNSGFGDAPQQIVDEYLWIPDVHLNLKLRRGTADQDGLKFKRFETRQGDLEKWTESDDEIFPFPLSPRAWALLLSEIGNPLPAGFQPPLAADRQTTLETLRQIEPRTRTLTVVKERRFRVWNRGLNVRVELAEILAPMQITSVGLEVWDPAQRLDDAASTALLEECICDLGVRREALEAINYLEYLKRSIV